MNYLKLDEIRIDGSTQPRAEINHEVVDEYAESFSRGDKFPPLAVVFDGIENWLYDGFHRWHGAKKARVDTVQVETAHGTLADARWLSLATNQTHGLRRTNADKRKAVISALSTKPELSDNAIAQHCGVDHKTVAKYREEVAVPCNSDLGSSQVDSQEQPQAESNHENMGSAPCSPPDGAGNNVPAPQSRVGTDGRTYNTSNIGKNNYPVPEPAKKAVAKDTLGREIPDECLAVWQRRGEIQELLTKLSQVRVAVQKAQDTDDILFADVNHTSIMAELNNAYTEIKSAMPYAVCPMCQGFGACRLCKDKGMISQFKWNTAIPQETKDKIEQIIKDQDK